MDPRGDLDVSEKRFISSPADSNCGSSSPKPSHYRDYALLRNLRIYLQECTASQPTSPQP